MKPQFFAAALALALVSQGANAIPIVGFQPDPAVVLVGDTFQLLLQGTDFDTTADGKTINNVTGGQKFNLQFSSGLLQILGVNIDPRWSFGNKTGTLDNTAGTLTGLAFGTFPATTDDSFSIASITFKALQAGQGQVTVTGGEFAAKVNNVSGSKILPAFDNATIQVSAVPEPPQWAMLMTGLGLVGWRMRKG
jgi:hypothetical protein